MTPDSLYERQRALSKSEYFSDAIAGRGPGSGVRASARNVAKLLVSVLATDALADVPRLTKKLASAKHDAGVCPLTGEGRFLGAVERIIGAGSLAKTVRTIEVSRLDLSATIAAADGPAPSRFGVSQRKAPGINLEIIARLPGWGAEIIADDLEKISAGETLPDNWHA